MSRTAATTNPPCPHCHQTPTIANGSVHGRRRWRCPRCRRSFGRTTGTVMAGLKVPPAEVARALQVVMRRGSLRAAEEITGHKYETIGGWLRRAAGHAELLTTALVHDLHLSEVEVDEFWSFVHHKATPPKKGGPPRTPSLPLRPPTGPVASGGGV